MNMRKGMTVLATGLAVLVSAMIFCMTPAVASAETNGAHVSVANSAFVTYSDASDYEINLNTTPIENFTNVQFIENRNYFYLNPKHRDNDSSDNPLGMCTTVAMQMLLGYHNYYSDRRLIPATTADGTRFLSDDYGNLAQHPVVLSARHYKPGYSSLGTEDSVYRAIFDMEFWGSLVGQMFPFVSSAGKKFVETYAADIQDEVSIDWAIFSQAEAMAEIRAGRPIMVGINPAKLTGASLDNWHVMVAYGYAEYAGQLGFVVHKGWEGDDTQVWYPADWLGFQLTMAVEHTHTFEDLGVNIEGQYRGIKCNVCGCETLESIYTLNTRGDRIEGIKEEYTDIKEIKIPDRINGQIRILSVADGAFANMGITAVTFLGDTTSIGKSAFKNCVQLTQARLPGQLMEIGDETFYGCKSLGDMSLPSTVKKIGNSAFENCSKLTISSWASELTTIGERAFYGCALLDRINLSPLVDSIGSAAFLYCTNLSYADIPDAITEIKDNTFAFCSSLRSVVLPKALTHIGWAAFIGTAIDEIAIPDTVKSIGSSAFGFCSNLTSITIPDSVTELGNNAFNGCRKLSSVSLSNSLTAINEGVFLSCESLLSIDIPEGITSIGNQAFRASGLNSITFPYSTKVLGNGVFQDCPNLSEVDFYYGIETIGKEVFMNCSSLTTLSIPFNITTIGEGAFRECTALTDVNLSYTLERIPDYMFYNCTALQNVNILNNITQIGAYAFYGCGLQNLVISDNVATIGERAFDNSRLETIAVSPNNSTFSTQDGILYNKAKTEIVYVPNRIGGGVIVPRTVKTIAGDSFNGRVQLHSVTIPREVGTIQSSAFNGCTNLTIYVETHSTAPNDWDTSWNASNRPVIWRCTLSTSGYITSVYKTADGISNAETIGGIKAPYCDGSEFTGWATTQTGAPAYSATDIINAPNNTTLYAIWKSLFADDFEFVLIDSGKSYEVKVKKGATLTGDVTIPATYRGLPVTKIADRGFAHNTNANAYAKTDAITSISLPDTLLEIGISGFANCVGVESVHISESSSLKAIGDQAFAECIELKEFYLPKHVNRIGVLSFYKCFAMTRFVFADESEIQTIENNAFDMCSVMTDILLPDTLKNIGTYVFDSCGRLATVKLPVGITSIPEGMFMGCGSLQNISIPATVKVIGKNAFGYCAIKNIYIPASVTDIGEFAFRNCKPDNITVEMGNAFYTAKGNCLIQINNNALIVGANNSTIPATVTSIGRYAFYGCDITSVTIPKSVTVIDANAFGFCKNLKTVVIPSDSNLTSIGDSAFAYTAITEIFIPAKVTFINSAFYACKELKNAYFANPNGWWYCYPSSSTSGTSLATSDIVNATTAATYLTKTYSSYTWKRG
ncbi:MAG: leucine-rich repeat domain-containing protein [Clostridia bacterium]|nr:leucine-rich repeat domain-containing protein [Clostridia bacterium]